MESMNNSHELAPAAALDYMLGGHGKATLVGSKSRYTYRFGSKKTPTGPNQDSGFSEKKVLDLVFVSVLTGPDNETDFQYIGYISRSRPDGLNQGKKGNPNHPAYRALTWYLQAIQFAPYAAAKATFMHEGTCARCGRALTTPESIEIGIGPVCLTK